MKSKQKEEKKKIIFTVLVFLFNSVFFAFVSWYLQEYHNQTLIFRQQTTEELKQLDTLINISRANTDEKFLKWKDFQQYKEKEAKLKLHFDEKINDLELLLINNRLNEK